MDAQLQNELTKSKSTNLASALRNFAQSASNTVAENVSAPIDAITWALRKAGMPINKPVMGSEWLAEKGFTRPVNDDTSKMAGEFVGLASPIAFEKSVATKLAGALRDGLPKNLPIGNMFIGESANTWDAVSAAQAKALEKQGKTPQEIWKETGTFKGLDGKYRQEIPDNMAKGTYTHLEGVNGGNRLSNSVVDHPELMQAYPELSNISQLGLQGGHKGAFEPTYVNDVYSGRGTLSATAPDENALKSVGLHELQHAIQHKEGFAKGGSLSDMPSLADYRNLAGEAEARATQARMGMDAAQRRATFPYDSYDVPINQLIVK